MKYLCTGTCRVDFMKLGITGQQDLSRTEILWAKQEMTHVIERCNVIEGFSCLAIGADQLFTQILSEQNLPYTAIIPCEKYEETFAEKNIDSFNKHTTNATNIITMPFSGPSEKAFYEAGKKVAELCDLMFAVWDGEVNRRLGGTGDIVRYALSLGRNIIHFNTLSKKIMQL